MPNPLKKFFRRPTVRRVKKVASRQFRKIFPERGFYDIGKYRQRGGVPEWLSKQIRLEDAAWEHGLQPRPYKGRRHSLEQHPQKGGPTRFHTFDGYLPCEEGMLSDFSQSMSLANLSELVTGDSRTPRDFHTHYSIGALRSAYVCKSLKEACSAITKNSPATMSHQSGSPNFGAFDPHGISTPQRFPNQCNTGMPKGEVCRLNESAPAVMLDSSTTHRELMFMLDQLEMIELERIMKDLRQFQSSRRKLMFDVSSLSASSTPPAALMKSTATPQPAAIMNPSSPSITMS